MHEFKDLFSAEVLAPGQQVGIKNVAILFSDLEGSTSLYEAIGDAVMAVSYRSEDGVHAALNIQKHIKAYNKKYGENIVLKVGLHCGPAIVVNSNDRLDYFGRTVNIAARIQAKSKGGDIVIHKELFDSDNIRLLLEQNNVHIQPFTETLKGIESEVKIIRIQ